MWPPGGAPPGDIATTAGQRARTGTHQRSSARSRTRPHLLCEAVDICALCSSVEGQDRPTLGARIGHLHDCRHARDGLLTHACAARARRVASHARACARLHVHTRECGAGAATQPVELAAHRAVEVVVVNQHDPAAAARAALAALAAPLIERPRHTGRSQSARLLPHARTLLTTPLRTTVTHAPPCLVEVGVGGDAHAPHAVRAAEDARQRGRERRLARAGQADEHHHQRGGPHRCIGWARGRPCARAGRASTVAADVCVCACVCVVRGAGRWSLSGAHRRPRAAPCGLG